MASFDTSCHSHVTDVVSTTLLLASSDCDNAVGVSLHAWDEHVHVTASSFLDDVNSPQSARLSPVGRSGTGWIPKEPDQKQQWIQV